MAITKTNFIEYTRCKRYVALEHLKEDKKSSKMSLEEYKKEELNEQKKELLDHLFESSDDEDIDLTKKEDIQLVAMMDYYKQVELLAGLQIEKTFKGKTIYSKDTYLQESFDFLDKGIRYLCYVDIYNEDKDIINIIEVKATTSNKYRTLEYGERGKEKYPLFLKEDNIYKLNKPIDESLEKNYYEKINKLKNRYTDVGKYIYDISVQRFIIENDFKQNNINKKVNYFLAVLNDEYIYDGYQENNINIYHEINNQELITLIDVNELTKDMQSIIKHDQSLLIGYINNEDNSSCKVGKHCELKKRTECIYKDICFKEVPKTNNSFSYMNFRTFKDEHGTTYDKYDLINNGYYKLDNIPNNWLTNQNHIIQRDCFDHNEIYIDKSKIKAFIDELKYPIYHLDFETFPCPIPRFNGEKPYTQSCFEFSLHIEKSPGVCDKEKDNYVFMASSIEDERLKLVKALVSNIDYKKGTMFAQNHSFEKARLKELSEIFKEYKKELLGIRDISFDLLYIIKNNKSLAQDLNLDNVDKVNYYNTLQSGSYSIKKTLPLFTNLKYSDLDIQNGTEALVEYSKFSKMTKEQIEQTRKKLIEYCKQDTWAMVEILKGLRKTIDCKINV